jgi:hypothetical protein
VTGFTRVLGSNGAENSLKDSGDLDHRIGRAPERPQPGMATTRDRVGHTTSKVGVDPILPYQGSDLPTPLFRGTSRQLSTHGKPSSNHDDRPTKLAQAVAELGRIDKTIHSLTYIDDESKRRRTLTQLNRGEDRHKLARAVFHGKRGELRQRYREGQEDQLGTLGLVVNIIVLWNTLYIDAALQQLRAEGFPVPPEDVARLSPLVYEHINLLGRYAFSVPDAVQRGQLRPLRTSSEAIEELS